MHISSMFMYSTIASFLIYSDGAPRLANPISWANWENSSSANRGTWPNNSWQTSLKKKVKKYQINRCYMTPEINRYMVNSCFKIENKIGKCFFVYQWWMIHQLQRNRTRQNQRSLISKYLFSYWIRYSIGNNFTFNVIIKHTVRVCTLASSCDVCTVWNETCGKPILIKSHVTTTTRPRA